MTLTVYGAGYSVYSRILRLALIEKGVAHDWVEVDVFDRPEDRTAQTKRHPFGKIPSLDHDGVNIYETGAALRYLEQPAFGPVRLILEDPVLRARADQIAGIADAYGYRGMVWDVFVELRRKPVADDDTVARGLEMSGKVLAAVEDLAGTGEVLVGAAPSTADLYFAPVLAYFLRTPPGPKMLARHPRISEWWAHWRARPSMVETRFPQEIA